MVPSSPNGPCSSGKTTSTSPRLRGGLAGLLDRQGAVGGCRAARRRPPRSAATSGMWPAVSSRCERVVRREHPVAVARDADRHDVVAVAVDGAQDAGGGRARHRVLGGAAPEDEGDAGLAGGVWLLVGHRRRAYRPHCGDPDAARSARLVWPGDRRAPRPRHPPRRPRSPGPAARLRGQRPPRVLLDLPRRRAGQLRAGGEPDVVGLRGGARGDWRAARPSSSPRGWRRSQRRSASCPTAAPWWCRRTPTTARPPSSTSSRRPAR